MIEDFQGKIINDADVSLPTMEDMYYNSLAPMLDIDLKTEEMAFYIETPPDGEEAVGMSADGTIFTIKTGPGYDKNSQKAAFNIPTASLYTNMNDYTTLALTTSKCDVGDNAQNKEILAQLTNGAALEAYLQGKYSGKSYNLGDMKVRLLYVDGPKLPKYTTEWLEKKYVKQKAFSEIKNLEGIHAQPFHSEFDANNGTLSLDNPPDIKTYSDADKVYVYENNNFLGIGTKSVQVWPYTASTLNSPSYNELDAYGPALDLTSDDFGRYSTLYRSITDEDYKRVGLTRLTIENNSYQPGEKKFSSLDSLGRCGSAITCVGQENVPDPNIARQPLSSVSPTGWHNYFFDCIQYIETDHENEEDEDKGDGVRRSLYNRCHLIAYSLSGENANSLNLITGTDSLNKAAMYNNCELLIKNYIKNNPGKHVLYRVTPDFHGDNLVAHGVLMEALSVEDNGDSLSIFIYCPNTQPNIIINYKTGEAWVEGDANNDVLNTYAKFYVLNNNEAQLETVNLAYKMRNLALQTIRDAEDTRLCVSVNTIGRTSNYKAPYDNGYADPSTTLGQVIEQVARDLGSTFFGDTDWFRCSGYNMYGMDAYGRILGVVYVKININGKLEWVNLNKYLIYHIYNSNEVKQSNFIPDGLGFSDYYKDPISERFKAWTYDIENFNYQDNWWTQMETRYGQDLRRRQIQERAFQKAGIHPNLGKDTSTGEGSFLNCLKDWTVSIGDVTFLCPPSAIKVSTTTSTERLPVLRAKGSMAKNTEKAYTEIELHLFFNNESGINGVELQGESLWENKDKDDPNKKTVSDIKVTYYMNGLRALISEFKFTPFLPVVNTYLNRTMKIAAVSLEQLDIETVPNFPRLIKAVLKLKAFDYSVYMPEIPEMFVLSENEATNEVENPFSQCINYDAMRYYYQKPLIYGNELANKLLNPKESNYSFNSSEFIKDTVMKNRTALMPCQFLDPNIDIYVANEDYLKRLFEIKKDAMTRAASGGASNNFIPNSAESKFLADIHNLWVDCGVGTIYNKYYGYRYSLVQAYKNTFPPANKEFLVTLGNTLVTLAKNKVDQVNLQELITEHVCKPMYEEIKKACFSSSILNSEGLQLVKDVYYASGISYATQIQLNAPYNAEESDIEALWDQFKLENKLDEDFNASLVRSSVLTLNLSHRGYAITSSNPDEPIQFEPDYLPSFLTWCAANSEDFLNANQEASELKEAIDWETSKSIQYDLIAEDVRVDKFNSSMSNNFAQISFLDSEGFAPQYTGSSDIHITWSITTKDERFAMIMKRLPELEAYYMRKYHLVLPCFPIRIDSEFTRMIGVYEVSVEEVMVTTVPNQPELYHIEMRVISVDRTLRNREALKSIDNEVDTNANGISGEIDNKGLIASSLNTKLKIKTFDDLDEKLALAEVYPDLELPTIGELGEKGFVFLRYKEKERDRNDLFVDPDFYFCYPFSTGAEAMRGVIQANFNGTDLENTNKVTEITTVFSDNSGNTGATFSAKDNRVSFEGANDKLKEEVAKVQQSRAEQQANISNLQNIDIIKSVPAAFLGDPGKWDISTKIMCSFMESYYLGLQNLANKNKDNEELKAAEKAVEEDDDVTTEAVQDVERNKKLEELKEFCDNSMSGKDEALKNLYDYIKSNPVDASVTPGETNISKSETFNLDGVYGDINYKYASFLSDLYIDFAKIGKTSFGNFVQAMWAANTGAYEYNSTLSDDWWKGKIGFMGWYKNADNECLKASEEVDFKKMQSFGPMDIQLYSYSDIMKYLDEDERKEVDTYCNQLSLPDTPDKFNLRFPLDPYYRLKDETTVKDYLERCQKNINFATRAFVRIALWWLYKLYKAQIFPSITLDIMAKNTKANVTAKVKAAKLVEEEYKQSVYIDKTLLENINSFVENNKVSLDAGKIFSAFVMALYNVPLDSNPIYTMMLKRDYDGLNAKLAELVSEGYKKRAKIDNKDALFRKFLLALCGFKEIAGPEYIGRSSGVTPASRFITNHNTKIAIEAASDPKQFVFHSFYDMLRNDYRGRMLRAFPTFYCVFMDEGKEIGLWKLHDNFYSINSIVDISIVKSRKIPADTCTLLLSNNYSTFTTEDEDGYINYKDASWGDLWDSVFNKKKVANEAEKRRLAATKVNKAKLSPGIRIHVREGYGSDARELAGVFNGVIASVEPGNQAIQIVAQGNGIELANPILEDRDADEIQYKDIPSDAINNTEGAGASPRTILTSMLTTNNGAVKTYLRGEYSDNQWLWPNGVKDNQGDSLIDAWSEWVADVWNANAYGIVHFGDPKYKDVFPGGEIIQNIYEVSSLPNMAQDGVMLYTDKEDLLEPPYISFEPRGKTFWDVMHICQSVAPDYVTGTASFGFRDTIFFGKPHYYYAYQYKKFNGVYVEKRKPFSQYHMIFSDSDIIINNITASSDKIKTCATGLYKDKAGWVDRNKDVGPLWVDSDIYPESQKSTLVDTRLKMKDNNPLLFRNTSPQIKTGWFVLDGVKNFIQNSAQSAANAVFGAFGTIGSILTEDYLGFLFDDKGAYSSHKKIAWAATANGLKESVKEMYQGEITILGSPSIKPHDRLIIKDQYNDMSGSVLVRDVVHSLNSLTGFTTTMHVDAISTVDDKNELYIQHFGVYLLAQAGLFAGLNHVLYKRVETGLGIISDSYKATSSKVAGTLGKTFETKALKTTMVDNLKKVKDLVTDKKFITASIKAFSKGATVLTAALGVGNIFAWLAKELIVDVVITGIIGSVNDALLYAVKNRQVLQIFPLKKNGMVYTAGLDGSLGLVYGSPTYGEFGPMEKMYNLIFAPPKGAPNGLGGTVAYLLRTFLVSPELQAEAAKYSRDLSYASKMGDNAEGQEIALESVSIGINKKPQFSVLKKNAFDLSLGNRPTKKEKNNKEYRAIKSGLNRYHVDRIEDLLAGSDRKNQVLIAQYTPLSPYIKSKFLIIGHDSLSTTEDKLKLQKIDTVISNQKVEVNGIRVDADITDVPFLAKDALILLKDICDRCWLKLDVDNQKDEAAIEKVLNGTKIVVCSALRVGDPNWYCSSGYSFSIKGTNKLESKTLRQLITEYHTEIKTKLQAAKTDKEPCFELAEDKGSDEIRIYIHPESPIASIVKENDDKKKEATINNG